jgi:FKBP-type peptidyl-prolyl cis-trans isomerase
MKHFFSVLFLFFFAAGFSFANGIAENSGSGEKTDLSYALGMLMAENLMDGGLDLNYDAVARGLRDAMEGNALRFSFDEAMEKVDAAFTAAQRNLAEKNRADGEAFLAQNAEKPGVQTLPSGLQYEMLTEGSGEMPGIDDVVLVNYQGATIDGEVFDSTYERGEPVMIPLYRVIPGWSEGLRLMREGEKARLVIPPNLAYGEAGAGDAIAPNSVLVFEVELISISRDDEAKDDETTADDYFSQDDFEEIVFEISN